MATVFPLVLCRLLHLVPVGAVQVGDVTVKSLAHKWTNRYCSVATLRPAILFMTFIDHTSPDLIQLVSLGIVEIVNDSIYEKLEVLETRLPCI